MLRLSSSPFKFIQKQSPEVFYWCKTTDEKVFEIYHEIHKEKTC